MFPVSSNPEAVTVMGVLPTALFGLTSTLSATASAANATLSMATNASRTVDE